MNRIDAANIAVKYKKHYELYKIHRNRYKIFREDNDKNSQNFHYGCMQMALQIFEENSKQHGFGSPDHAIEVMG